MTPNDQTEYHYCGHLRNSVNVTININTTSTSVFGDWRISTHADPTSSRRAIVFGSQRVIVVNVVEVVARWPISPILGFWGAKYTKMGDSLPWTPMNRRAKFDAASYILGGEIRNRTNTHIHVNTQTHKHRVNDMSTHCLSACVDINTNIKHSDWIATHRQV